MDNKEKKNSHKKICDISLSCKEITETQKQRLNMLRKHAPFGAREWDIYVSISTYMSTTCRKPNSVHELIKRNRDSES